MEYIKMSKSGGLLAETPPCNECGKVCKNYIEGWYFNVKNLVALCNNCKSK